MADVWLILGGARSGKTRRGLALANRSSLPVYIATAEARDEEMRTRIARHREERGPQWRTIEAPLDLRSALTDVDVEGGAILVDCLTLWLSNLMEAGMSPDDETEHLMESLKPLSSTIIFVSNEVGLGIVPDNALARSFRDAQGRLNQQVAAAADHVEFVAAGLPLTLK
ncbi:MAG TPA: bifunctional adenosylcobinamide kinase/adenosylcobinamide-phosphate guanylyltransferase [Rhizomicrobium sp.]|jgi:adenosylcobinamide kinase/adenosylcobinamide-phosphate guanylyltransferase